MQKRILLVDDEPDIVTVMKFTLENKGFEIITAYDGKEGFEKAKDYNPDLIILDVLMPKIFGDDLAHKLKSDLETKSIPVIFLTNLPLPFLTGSEKEGLELQRDSQGNLYVSKSCTEEELLYAVNLVLP